MQAQLQEHIASLVQQEIGWDPLDIESFEAQKLRHAECRGYRIMNMAFDSPFIACYVTLPGGRIIGNTSGEESAVRDIIDTYGPSAPAAWWAEVLAIFHPEAAGDIVLHSALEDTQATRRIRASGRSFFPPTMVTEGGVTTITFYTMDYDADIPLLLTATRRGEGPFSLELIEL